MRGFSGERETWRQFAIGLAVMLPWPVIAAVAQGLEDPFDYVIYLVGMFWSLLWDPVAEIQAKLPSGLEPFFTYGLLVALLLVWLAVAALPLFGHWPRRHVVGLWALQFGYAGAQALSGFFYVQTFILPAK